MSPSLRRPGRVPGTVNLGVAVAVLAVLLPLMLNAATSSPPTASEFSPNARQVIRKAPPGQAPESNAGAAAPSPTPTLGPSPTARPAPTSQVRVAESDVKRCRE